MGKILLRIVGLKKYFPIIGSLLKRKIGEIKAVDGISFDIEEGKTFALIGETGSGKTTAGKTIIRIYPLTSGEVWFEGQNIAELKEKELKGIRSKMQMIYQDPTSSLNPRRMVKDIVADPLVIHGVGSRSSRLKKVEKMLNLVELPSEYMYRFPYGLSGGEKQRVGIARALILNPNFVVLDEPTSSLDVSVQAKVLSLIKRLQRDLNLTYLFISHDLSVIRNISDVVGVMYFGKLMEVAPTDALFAQPVHPYTRTLLSAIPTLGEDVLLPEPVELSEGEVEEISLTNPPKGCRFYHRCALGQDICRREAPPRRVGKDHFVYCHLTSS